MEGSKKGESPSKYRKSPSPTGENDENDSNQNRMIPSLQNQKKVGVKHFMSPTISAASKAAVPRKKILADSNENSVSSGAQIQDNFNLDPKRISRKPSTHSSTRVVSSYSHASESDDDIDSLANSSSKPYDPLTNYLSPRPKYLRFNPNRRDVILTRLQKEDLNGSFESQEFNDEEEKESNEDVGNSEIEDWNKNDGSEEEMDEEDEEEEEEEELEGERGWSLRGVMKILFTVIACLLWTSCMCSMNSTSPSPIQQAIWDLKDGYLMIQKQTLEVISTKMHETGFLAVEEGDSYQELDGVEIDENGEMDNEESIEVEMVEEYELNLEGRKEELVHNENEDEPDQTDEAEQIGEFEFKGENLAQLVDETGDTDSNGLEKEVEPSNLDSNEDDADKMEAEEKEVVGDSEAESETDDESNSAGNSELEKEADNSNELQEQLSLKFSPYQEDEESPKDVEGLDSIESSEELTESHEKSTVSVDEVNEIRYDNEGQIEKSGWNTVIIGVSLVSIIFASLAAFFYRSKKARITSAGQSQSVVKPPQSNVEQKVTPELSAMDVKNLSSLKSLSSVSSKEEAPEELNHRIHVPTAELVGEIFIGDVSSSAGVYARKSQMSEFQETSSVTIFAKQGSPPQPVTTPKQPSTLNVSYTTSDSHGSFTAERKILKKEGSNSGKAMAEVTTPLRRSSRLRSCAAVMSP